jgi:hypothetical protein
MPSSAATAIAFDIHLEDRGVVHQAVDDGFSISRLAEHDITPQYRNDCHP